MPIVLIFDFKAISINTPAWAQGERMSLILNLNQTLSRGRLSSLINNALRERVWPRKTKEMHGNMYSIKFKLALYFSALCSNETFSTKLF